MISVRSLLQQLNGNKKIFIALAVMFSGLFFAFTYVKVEKQREERVYNVGILLPFYLNDPNHSSNKLGEAMLDYYEGVLLALEDLKARGFNAKVFVYDTQKDGKVVEQILMKPELQTMHLIIGPLYDNEIEPVEKFCSVYNIPLVLPLRQYNKKSKADFPVLNTVPVDSFRYRYMGEFLAKRFKNHKFVMVNDKAKESYLLRKHLTSGFNAAGGKGMKEVETGALNWPEISVVDTLFVLIPSYKEMTMRSVLGSIRKMKRVKVLGMEEWMDFAVLDYNLWEECNVHFLTTYQALSADTISHPIRQGYREKFGGEPGRYTCMAYDQTLFFIDALSAFGSQFASKIMNHSFEYQSGVFRFVAKGQVYENAGLNLLWYNEHRLKRIQSY